MNLLDVNILVALFRAEHVHHVRAVRWWKESERTGASFTVPDVVAVGFCRLTTNPRVYTTPASFREAADFLSVLGSHDLCLRYAPDQRTMVQFVQLGLGTNVRGNLVSDAYIAACALSLGATVVTFDRDFRRFDGLKVLEPAEITLTRPPCVTGQRAREPTPRLGSTSAVPGDRVRLPPE